MKSKLDLAHEYAMKFIGAAWRDDIDSDFNHNLISINSWEYADKMYKQLEERESKGVSEAILNGCNSTKLEWQPDWSQAPDWAIVYTYDQIGGQWWDVYPFDSETMWLAEGIFQCISSPSFDYKGDWKDSLRKRPEDK